MKIIRYQGNPIQLDLSKARVSLTDLWRAAGSPAGLKPAQWRSNVSVQRFAEYLREDLKVSGRYPEGSVDVFHVIQGGNNPQTWAHWQMALAYAQDLSPAFRAWCGQVLRRHMEAREVEVMNKATTQMLQTPSGLRTLRQLEAHLKRLVERRALSSSEATNILSEMFNLTLGLRLPQVATRPKPTITPPPQEEEVEASPEAPASVVDEESAEPPPEAPPLEVDGEYVHPGPNEVAATDPILPPNTFTGNGAADAIDKMDQINGVGTFTCWMTRRNLRTDDRNIRGREFCRLMRELRMYPAKTQGYDPPPPATTERYAGIYPTKAVRTISTGEAGHGVRDVVLFHPPALKLMISHLREQMGLMNGGSKEVPPMSGVARAES